jgi:hypothetical protein
MRHPPTPRARTPQRTAARLLPLATLPLATLPLATLPLAACDSAPATQVTQPIAGAEGALDMGAGGSALTADALTADALTADALTADALTPDICEGQICAPGYKCDARGDCVEECSDVVCDAGRVCRGGECVDPCAQIACAEGLTCRLGECVDLCAGVSCAEVERCEPSTGECVDRCEGVSCPSALRCSPQTGACVAQCDGVLCGSEEVCDARTGVCVDLCEGVSCVQGLSCDPSSGACVDPCEGVVCASGWECLSGDCRYDDPCAGVTCPAATLCDDRTLRCGLFFCTPDAFDAAAVNNLVDDATALPSGTQRIDELTVCLFDIDWYELFVPARTALRVGLRYQPAVGLLNLRLYEPSSVLRAAAEVDAPLGDAFVSVLPEASARSVWVRVASANGQFSQNRYTLTVEQNLPGALCNQDAQCGAGRLCVRGLCGGVGELNPDPTPPTDPPADPPADPVTPPAPACADDAREPNDAFMSATEVASGGAVTYAGVICADNADVFKIDLAAPSEVRATLGYTYATGDLDLYLLDATGAPLSTSIGVSDTEEVSALLPSAGRVYLSVFGAAADDQGPYSLSVSVTPSALPTDACVDRFDPNDTLDRAVDLPLPAIHEGLVVCEDDFYSFMLAEGQTIQITTRFTHAEGDIDITLFDPTGASVDFSFGYGNIESISYTVPAGAGGLYVLNAQLFRSAGPQTYSLSALIAP